MVNSAAAKAPAQESTSLVTGVGRGSYVHVFEPRLNELSGAEEYSMAFLIPKTDSQTLAGLKAAIEAAANAKWPDGKRPPNLRSPLRDGDTEKSDDPAYAGHYWINLKGRDKPGIVDAAVQPVLDSREFVSGDFCRVSVNAYGYDKKGNRGVAFGLRNIQVTAKGDPLSGGSRAEDDFSVVEQASLDDADPWS